MNIASDQFHEKRNAKRFKLEKSGIIYDADIIRHKIDLMDISTNGMKISGIELDVEQEVIIEWCEMDIYGKVVWAFEADAGILFRDYLDETHPLLELANALNN